jgi:hypothetical protein
MLAKFQNLKQRKTMEYNSQRKSMSFLNKITNVLTRSKVKQFEDLPNWLLAFLGIASFLVAGYWGLVLGDVTPPFVKKVNEVGFSPQVFSIALLLGCLGLLFWFFGCIAARCHTLIYERWFK